MSAAELDPARHGEFLVFAPEGRDAPVIGHLLASAGLGCRRDAIGDLLFAAMIEGDAAGAIVTDSALARLDQRRLRHAIEQQPPWSDFPFIMLARRGEARSGLPMMEEMLNVTVIERPLHPASLVSAARSAMRARTRQRLAGRHLAERERARAELRDLAQALEAKVAERTRDLAAANERLIAEMAERERAEARLIQAQKMEAVGQLTGGIAHDFNNLLTAVVGSLDLLLRRTDDEKLQRLARNALQAGERGAQLTSQLLAFSRRQRLSPTTVQPNQIVRGMGDLLARSIRPQVRVETALQPDLWHALADPTQIEMMLLNLAINARDAMPSGGRLTISTSNVASDRLPRSEDLAEGEYICIDVADTGTGMTPDVLARAFEPFFTTKGQGRGTGLGLSQIYGFAKQSGGAVRIRSRLGEGTTVSVYLPRSAAAIEAEQPAAITPAPALRQTILLVDDDDDVRITATAMAEEIGYEVVAAESGEAALRALEGGGVVLMLTDVAMPGMSGVELARRVRERFPALPILFASGYADLDQFGSDLEEEAVLKKPYRITELAARLSATLADRPAGDNVVEFRR